jgi:hypothetical protein
MNREKTTFIFCLKSKKTLFSFMLKAAGSNPAECVRNYGLRYSVFMIMIPVWYLSNPCFCKLPYK